MCKGTSIVITLTSLWHTTFSFAVLERGSPLFEWITLMYYRSSTFGVWLSIIVWHLFPLFVLCMSYKVIKRLKLRPSNQEHLGMCVRQLSVIKANFTVICMKLSIQQFEPARENFWINPTFCLWFVSVWQIL